MKEHMARDQHGTYYHALGKYPRKALLERLNRQHADKMYVDREGSTVHIGYVIAGLWLTIYKVTSWEKEA